MPRAFTLVELLVVIAVVALLIGLLLPGLGAARRNAQGTLAMSNMRQIVTAAAMYADTHKERFPATMSPGPSGLPETINYWDIQGYQNALNQYIGGMQGGVDASGGERSKRSVWFEPADPDRDVPAMWSSFSDNGLITGVGARMPDLARPSGTVYAALRHSRWAEVVGVSVPATLPLNNPGDAFWSSEFFDMCFDPWSDSADASDPYFWRRGRAAPPIDLFPDEPGATAWADQVDGRHPAVAPNRKGRYGKGGYYSRCDASVRYSTFEETYVSPASNAWSIR